MIYKLNLENIDLYNAKVYVKNIDKEFFLDDLSSSIINNLNKATTIDELTNLVDLELKTDDKSLLKEEIIRYLDKLNILKVVEISNNKDNIHNEDIFVKIAGDKDYKQISKFIIENINKESNSLNVIYDKNIEIAYSETALRARQFNNIEYNFMAINNSKIVGYISIFMPTTNSTNCVANISNLILDKNLTENLKSDLVCKMINFAENSFESDLSKLRICLNKNNSIDVIKYLNKLNFYEDFNTTESVYYAKII